MEEPTAEELKAYLGALISIFTEQEALDLMKSLIAQMDPRYSKLIQVITRDVQKTRVEQPNLNFHLYDRQVLRWDASKQQFLLFPEDEWHELFKAAAEDYNRRYHQKSVFEMLVEGEWGHVN
jgi:hypothetical protein